MQWSVSIYKQSPGITQNPDLASHVNTVEQFKAQ